MKQGCTAVAAMVGIMLAAMLVDVLKTLIVWCQCSLPPGLDFDHFHLRWMQARTKIHIETLSEPLYADVSAFSVKLKRMKCNVLLTSVAACNNYSLEISTSKTEVLYSNQFITFSGTEQTEPSITSNGHQRTILYILVANSSKQCIMMKWIWGVVKHMWP